MQGLVEWLQAAGRVAGLTSQGSQALSLGTAACLPRATAFPWVGLSRRCVGGDARSLLRTGSDRAICDSDMSWTAGGQTCWTHLGPATDLLGSFRQGPLVPLSVCSREVSWKPLLTQKGVNTKSALLLHCDHGFVL